MYASGTEASEKASIVYSTLTGWLPVVVTRLIENCEGCLVPGGQQLTLGSIPGDYPVGISLYFIHVTPLTPATPLILYCHHW